MDFYYLNDILYDIGTKNMGNPIPISFQVIYSFSISKLKGF